MISQKKTKTIEVKEYVLPKFDVTIDSPKEFSAKDGKIRAVIRSKYTYGKFVKGEAIVSMTPLQSFSFYSPNRNKDSVLKTTKVDGKGFVEFGVDNDLHLDFAEHQTVQHYQLRATVIEELTGQNQTATKDIIVHESRYKVEANDLNHEVSPGLPLIFPVRESICNSKQFLCRCDNTLIYLLFELNFIILQLSVGHHDGSPVMLNEDTKWITVGKILNRYTNDESAVYHKFELNSNGTAEIKMPTSAKENNFYLVVSVS